MLTSPLVNTLSLYVILAYFASLTNSSEIKFKETTLSSGINYVGTSWAGGWRDYNNDGHVDLWTSNHGGKPGFYINNGEGSFTNGMSLIKNSIGRDAHGIAWADIDNDGDADLIEVVGAALGSGKGNNQLYINNGSKMIREKNDIGLNYPLGRGRIPLWLDYDQDGLLDILIMNQSRKDNEAPSALFRRYKNQFNDVTRDVGLDIGKTENDAFAILSNIHGSLPMEALIFGSGEPSFLPKVFQLKKGSFHEITREFFKEKL